MNTLTLHVPDMSCGHCRKAIEKALGDLDASSTIDFDMQARKVTVATESGSAEVIDALGKAGYSATPV